MATVINLKVKSDFAAASADLKKFGTVTESQRKKIEKFQKEFKDDSIKQFIDRNNRATAAIKATRGPVAALTSQYKAYQRQIETLIRRGLDPESKEIKELTGRYKKLEKELKDVTKAEKNQTKTLGITQGAMLAVGAGAAVMAKKAVSAFIDFSKESAQAASDAEEIEGKFNVVFRSIGREATDAASTIAKDFDLAASTVNKLLGDTGDILTGLGFDQKTALDLSESVGTLALDLASFTNFAGGAEGASAALTKALLGEAESAKALGIVIRQDTREYKDLVAGIMEAEGVGLTQAKALAALQIATEQSKNAIGDYARTMNSTANVQKRLGESQKQLKEAFGVTINEGLTPFRAVTADIVKSLADWINKNTEVNEFIKDMSNGVDTSTRNITELNMVVDAGAEAAEKMKKGFGDEFMQAVIDAGIEARKLVNNIALEVAMEKRFAQAIKDRDEISAKAAKDALDAIKGEQEALVSLEKLRVASLSAEEKRLEQIEGEIDRLVILKQAAKDTGEEWEAIERLLVVTLNEKNDLLNIITESVEAEATAVQESAIAFEATAERNAELLLEREDLRAGFHELELNRVAKEADAADALTKKKIDNVFEFANASLGVVNAIDSLQSANAAAELQRLEDKGASEEDLDQKRKEIARDAAKRGKKLALAKVAIDTASAIIGFLNNPGGFPGIALSALAGITGGISAAAINATPIPSLQTGTGSTPFIVPESAASSRADSQRIAVNPGEQVSVSPRGEGGRSITTIVEIDREVIYNVVNMGVESGEIRITADNIQGGAAVA